MPICIPAAGHRQLPRKRRPASRVRCHLLLADPGCRYVRQELHVGTAVLDRRVRERPAPLDEAPEQKPLGLTVYEARVGPDPARASALLAGIGWIPAASNSCS